MSSQNITYSVLVYDIPLTRREVYSKLRSRIRRAALPLTWSVYLIPDGIRNDVAAILKELDEEGDSKHRILWKILKFDDSEKDELDRITREGFDAIVKNTKEFLSEKIAVAEREFDEGEIDWDKMNAKRRKACSKAVRNIRDARQLALLFDASQMMAVAFESVEKVAEAHRQRIKEEVAAAKKKDKELREQREKEEAATDDTDAIELE
jgi:hypothetical protein